MIEQWAAIIVTTLCGGGIAFYCRAIDRKITIIDNKISKLPKEYVLKDDCDQDQREIKGMISEQRHTLDSINSKLGYVQGILEGKGATSQAR